MDRKKLYQERWRRIRSAEDAGLPPEGLGTAPRRRARLAEGAGNWIEAVFIFVLGRDELLPVRISWPSNRLQRISGARVSENRGIIDELGNDRLWPRPPRAHRRQDQKCPVGFYKCRLPNSPNFGKFQPRVGTVRSNDSSVTGNPEFWTTCWSAVLLSAQSEVPGSDLARDELCRLYWYPLYAFIRRRGYTADETLKTEYGAQGKATLFKALKPFLGLIGNKEPPGYESVAEKLNLSPGGVKTLIHRFRKRYAEILRAAVAQTVQDPADIDGEIHALCEALIAAEGQLGP
jgi:hypothetical protein